jgi:hypothetical protein
MIAVEHILAPVVAAELLDVCLATTARDELIRETLCQVFTNLLIGLSWNKRSHDCPPNCPFEKNFNSGGARSAAWIASAMRDFAIPNPRPSKLKPRFF